MKILRPVYPMRVLVACEFSGVVRQAFRDLGHHAWSCDLLPAEDGSAYHYEGDVLPHLDDGWNLMIAHLPCLPLAVTGTRWFKDKLVEQAEALEFVALLLGANIPRIALENPVSIISSRIRDPDQIIQPWEYGHGEAEATCLWLKGLPPLQPTDIVAGREAPEREPTRTLTGIAAAMASQWGGPYV